MKSKSQTLKWTFIVVFFILNATFSVETAKVKASTRKLSKIDDVEDTGVKNNGTSSLLSLLRVDKWTAPRFIAELSNSFSSAGLPATAMAGIGFVVLLPIYLASILVSWLPLKNIAGSTSVDDHDYDHYRAPSAHYGYPSATPSPHYGYPTPSPQYGYPAPSPQYGYHPAPEPSHSYGYHVSPSTTPSPHYGYPAPPSTPAPSNHYGYPAAPSPAPQYGYPDAPAPSAQYGYQQHSSSSSQNYAYADPSPPSHGYSAIHSAPAPSVQYGSSSKSSPAYGSPSSELAEPKTSEVPVNARSARSVGNEDEERCMERLACEITKATKSLKLPGWMDTLTGLMPREQNEVIAGARRLFTESRGCSRFRCNAIDKE